MRDYPGYSGKPDENTPPDPETMASGGSPYASYLNDSHNPALYKYGACVPGKTIIEVTDNSDCDHDEVRNINIEKYGDLWDQTGYYRAKLVAEGIDTDNDGSVG